MKARDIMTSPVITVEPQTSVGEIARLLLDKRISAVPVVDASGSLLGIVSEGDLLRRPEARTERRRSKWLELLLDRNVSAAEFVKTHGREAQDVMTTDVVEVGPEIEADEIVALLERHHIKRVPVVEEGRVVGIVSRANLLSLLVGENGNGAAAGEVSDAEIRDRIREVLTGELRLDLRRVDVVVEGGAVTLVGTVKSENQQRAITVAAENVRGVVSVEDKTRLDRFPGSTTY